MSAINKLIQDRFELFLDKIPTTATDVSLTHTSGFPSQELTSNENIFSLSHLDLQDVLPVFLKRLKPRNPLEFTLSSALRIINREKPLHTYTKNITVQLFEKKVSVTRWDPSQKFNYEGLESNRILAIDVCSTIKQSKYRSNLPFGDYDKFEGQIDVLKYHLSNPNFDINMNMCKTFPETVDPYSYGTILQYAASVNDADAINILAKQEDIDINSTIGNHGYTALSEAMMRRNLRAIKSLVSEGASVNQVNKDGSFPLLLAIDQWNKELSPETSRKIFLEVLNHPDCNLQLTDLRGNNVAHQAILSENLEALEELYKLNGAETLFNRPNKNGNTPILLAVRRAYKEGISFLAQETKTSFLSQDNAGVDILGVAKDAFQDYMKIRSIHKSSTTNCIEKRYSQQILEKGDLEKIKEVIELENCDLEYKIEGQTPLCIYLIQKFPESQDILQTLLGRKLRNLPFYNAQDTNKNSTLHHVISNQDLSALEFLSKYDCQFCPNMVNKNNQTPIMAAIESGFEEGVKLLLDWDDISLLPESNNQVNLVELAKMKKLSQETIDLLEDKLNNISQA